MQMASTKHLFNTICSLCRNRTRALTEDDKETLMDCEKRLMDADYGFSECKFMGGQCMTSRFDKNVKKCNPTVVEFKDVIHLNEGYSSKNGKCSLVFKVELLGSMECALHAFNFCDTEAGDENCPCGLNDGDPSLIGYIGRENNTGMALSVVGFVWNAKARVLWILERFCLTLPVSQQLDSFKYHVQSRIENYFTPLVGPNSTISTDVDMDDEGKGCAVAKRPRADERMEKQRQPLHFQYLHCDKLFCDHGELCFRQRLMDVVAPPLYCFVSAGIDPVIRDLWCPRDCTGREIPFSCFVSVKNFMDRIDLEDLGITEDVWNKFKLILVPPGTDQEYVIYEYFYETVKQFGYWWLKQGECSVLQVVIPFYGEDRELSSRPPRGERQAFLRKCRQFGHGVTAQFSPVGTIRGRQFGKISIVFDTITRKFFVPGGWDISGPDPIDCLRQFLGICEGEPDQLKLVPAAVSTESNGYVNKQ